MKSVKLTLITLLISFAYLSLMKYISDQPLDIISGFLIINSSCIFLATMIVVIIEAVKADAEVE